MSFSEQRRQAVLPFWHYDEMNVVRHQAPGPDFSSGLELGISNIDDVSVVIIVRKKGPLTAISALCYVMRVTRYYEPWQPGQCDAPLVK